MLCWPISRTAFLDISRIHWITSARKMGRHSLATALWGRDHRRSRWVPNEIRWMQCETKQNSPFSQHLHRSHGLRLVSSSCNSSTALVRRAMRRSGAPARCRAPRRHKSRTCLSSTRFCKTWAQLGTAPTLRNRTTSWNLVRSSTTSSAKQSRGRLLTAFSTNWAALSTSNRYMHFPTGKLPWTAPRKGSF